MIRKILTIAFVFITVSVTSQICQYCKKIDTTYTVQKDSIVEMVNLEGRMLSKKTICKAPSELENYSSSAIASLIHGKDLVVETDSTEKSFYGGIFFLEKIFHFKNPSFIEVSFRRARPTMDKAGNMILFIIFSIVIILIIRMDANYRIKSIILVLFVVPFLSLTINPKTPRFNSKYFWVNENNLIILSIGLLAFFVIKHFNDIRAKT